MITYGSVGVFTLHRDKIPMPLGIVVIVFYSLSDTDTLKAYKTYFAYGEKEQQHVHYSILFTCGLLFVLYSLYTRCERKYTRWLPATYQIVFCEQVVPWTFQVVQQQEILDHHFLNLENLYHINHGKKILQSSVGLLRI